VGCGAKSGRPSGRSAQIAFKGTGRQQRRGGRMLTPLLHERCVLKTTSSIPRNSGRQERRGWTQQRWPGRSTRKRGDMTDTISHNGSVFLPFFRTRKSPLRKGGRGRRGGLVGREKKGVGGFKIKAFGKTGKWKLAHSEGGT